MSKPLMCHVVAGYPDVKGCLELLKGMRQLGVAALEVQIPFSDPIADGETIMRANDAALAGGMTTAGSFDLIAEARRQGVDTDLYIMSYVQKVRHFGLAEFCRRAADCGAKGLIIPDLPYDSPEFGELRQLLSGRPMELVPVLSPGMAEDRLGAILALKPAAVYVTSQRGITGNKYAPAKQLRQLVDAIRASSKAEVMIGFGIASPGDVADALDIGDLAVVGSAVIDKVKTAGVKAALAYVGTLTEN